MIISVVFSLLLLTVWDANAKLRTIQLSGTLECCEDDLTTTTKSGVKGRFIPINDSTSTTAPTTGNLSENGSSPFSPRVLTANDESRSVDTKAAVEGIREKRNVRCEPVANAIIELSELDPLPCK